MSRFLIKTVTFILFSLCLLYSFDYIITKGLRKNKSNVFVDWNRIFNGEIKSNLIINGSSIAEIQISPCILDSVLKVDSYNFGMSGFSFYMQKARYDIFLEHNAAPEIIIQIVGDATLHKEDGMFQIDQFLPYLDDSIILKTTHDYKDLNYLDYHLPFIRYFGKTNTIFKGLASFFNIELIKSIKYKGYASNDLKWDNNFEKFKKINQEGKKMEITGTYLTLFKKFVQEESQKGRCVIIVFPPTYYLLKNYILNRDELIATYKSIANENNLLFLDYSQSEFSINRDYFYNATHLNRKGSELFSRKLASDIKKQIHFSKLHASGISPKVLETTVIQ